MIRRLAPSLLLATAMWAGDAAAPVDVRAADGAQLSAHWNASIYAKVWNDPALAKVRADFEAKMAAEKAKDGFDPRDVLTAMKNANLRLVDFVAKDGEPKPVLAAQADFGALAATLLKQAAKDGHKQTKIAGADEAWQKGDGTVARFGTALVLGVNLAPTQPWQVAPATADLSAAIDVKAVIAKLRAAIAEDKRGEFDAVVSSFSRTTKVDYQLSIVPEGLLEKMRAEAPTTGTQAVDRALLDRLPATTLMVASVGIDGAAAWKAYREQWLKAAAEGLEMKGASADEVEKKLDANLASEGIACPLADLVAGFTGTSFIAITQGAPFPGLTLVVPRSKGTDILIAKGLQEAGSQSPAQDGDTALVQLPNLPMPLTVLRDKTHWVATTDAVLAGEWGTGKPGGWAGSAAGKLALSKAPAGSFLIGASDTPAVIRTIAGFLPMALGMFVPDAKQQQDILGAINKLAGQVGTGYLVGAGAAGAVTIESRGLISLTGPLLIGGAIAGARSSSAHRVHGVSEVPAEAPAPNPAP